eukprot:5484003-Prymnesium_polylepis.1
MPRLLRVPCLHAAPVACAVPPCRSPLCLYRASMPPGALASAVPPCRSLLMLAGPPYRSPLIVSYLHAAWCPCLPQL